jgi:uncharacterized protein YceK
VKRPKSFACAAICLLLPGCASTYSLDNANPPSAFYDTRLQYALVSGDDATLAKDYGMKLPPSWAERTVAGVALPFAATTEVAFYPFSAAINAWAPGQR